MKPQSAARLIPSDPHFADDRRTGGAVSVGGQPIDLVHLTRQTFGDKRLEAELLRLFLRQSRHIGKSLTEAGAPGDQVAPNVELLHMLSGSARAIGAIEVAAMAGTIEARLRQTGEEGIEPGECEGLQDLLERTNLYIADLLDQG